MSSTMCMHCLKQICNYGIIPFRKRCRLQFRTKPSFNTDKNTVFGSSLGTFTTVSFLVILRKTVFLKIHVILYVTVCRPAGGIRVSTVLGGIIII
jgi:hypothetical protein